ncbi:MAG: helix-turn-helix domain-containing protein [Moorea sp. SIOASIH]|nr:helix-turn-helix domain-containing protein [Moorena sp. SIOASIH]
MNQQTKIVGTTQAAFLLGICVQRVRQLLKNGRIKGAQKVGRFWQIPLFNGLPKVSPGRRGPKGTWRRGFQKVATYIHVNQNVIKQNKKYDTYKPVLTVKQGNRNTYGHYVEIKGPSRLVYQPNCPKDCGATVWLEVDPSVEILTKVFS